MSRTKNKDTRDVNAALRATEALKLRAQRLTYAEVASRCGYASAGACHDAVQRELARIVVENVEELRREEAASLDQLEAVCWQRLEEDEFSKAKLFAVDRILAIKERRARLMGLDMQQDQVNANVVIVREIPQGYLQPAASAVEGSAS